MPPVRPPRIEENLAQGQQLRQDNFFHSDVEERSFADEIAEGVLLAAQHEHEEKKLKYYGNLLANIAFDATVDRNTANTLRNLAAQLSYQQVCYIALLVRRGAFGLSGTGRTVFEYLRPNASRTFTPQAALMSNIYDFFQRGLVLIGSYKSGTDYSLLPDLSTLGHGLYHLMDLGAIPDSELAELAHAIMNPQQLSGSHGMLVNVFRIGSDNHVLTKDIIQIFLMNTGDGFTIDGVAVARVDDDRTALWPTGHSNGEHVIVECANGQRFVTGELQMDTLEA